MSTDRILGSTAIVFAVTLSCFTVYRCAAPFLTTQSRHEAWFDYSLSKDFCIENPRCKVIQFNKVSENDGVYAYHALVSKKHNGQEFTQRFVVRADKKQDTMDVLKVDNFDRENNN